MSLLDVDSKIRWLKFKIKKGVFYAKVIKTLSNKSEYEESTVTILINDWIGDFSNLNKISLIEVEDRNRLVEMLKTDFKLGIDVSIDEVCNELDKELMSIAEVVHTGSCATMKHKSSSFNKLVISTYLSQLSKTGKMESIDLAFYIERD